MYDQYIEQLDEAEELFKNKQFERAGNRFTQAAFFAFSGCARFSEAYLSNEWQITEGIYSLINASLSFKLADLQCRGNWRSSMGALILKEIIKDLNNIDSQGEGEFEPKMGILYEFLGDFKVISSDNGFEEDYNRAKELYRNSSEPWDWQSQPGFEDNSRFFFEVAELAEYHLQKSEFRKTINNSGLQIRIEYKMDHFPKIVEILSEKFR